MLPGAHGPWAQGPFVGAAREEISTGLSGCCCPQQAPSGGRCCHRLSTGREAKPSSPTSPQAVCASLDGPQPSVSASPPLCREDTLVPREEVPQGFSDVFQSRVQPLAVLLLNSESRGSQLASPGEAALERPCPGVPVGPAPPVPPCEGPMPSPRGHRLCSQVRVGAEQCPSWLQGAQIQAQGPSPHTRQCTLRPSTCCGESSVWVTGRIYQQRHRRN